MRELNKRDLFQISGGTDVQTNQYVVQHEVSSLHLSLEVPPSTNGQVAQVTINVVQDTLINSWLY